MLRWCRNQWDRITGVIAIVVGAVVLLLGWVGASGTVYPAQQIPFLISGGLVGAVLIGLGATAWLSADMRDEWRKLDEIQHILSATQELSSDHGTKGAAETAPSAPAARLFESGAARPAVRS